MTLIEFLNSRTITELEDLVESYKHEWGKTLFSDYVLAQIGANRTGPSYAERLEYNQRKGFWTFDNGATAFDTKEEAEAAMSAEQKGGE